MVVDVHTHTPSHRSVVPAHERIVNHRWRPDREVTATNSWSDYDAACAEADLTIAFNIAVADPTGTTGIPSDHALGINESTAAFVAANPQRRLGFMSVHPEVPGAADEVDRCYYELGLRGIKLAPNYQSFDPLGTAARRVYSRAEALRIPILFHQGASPVRTATLRYAHPLLMDEVATLHPELRVILAHMGHPWQRDTIVTIRKHPYLYADVSALFYRPWSFYEGLVLASEWGVTDKLLLGSDFPLATTAETIRGVRAVNAVTEGTRLPRVPSEAIEGIINRDALALLGLPAPRVGAVN